jgi:hypothetical protein
MTTRPGGSPWRTSEFDENSKIYIRNEDYPKYLEGRKDPVAKGEHYDDGKPPMHLLDSEWLEEVARVLGFGGRKYTPENWRNGIAVTRLISSCYRHLSAVNKGEDQDPESGLSHAAHLSCDVMFLHWMLSKRKDLDDRWYK